MAESTRKITIAGDFSNSVKVANSLSVGDDCDASGCSEAVGYKSKANGEYSAAFGYMAEASGDKSFVWSGRSSEGAVSNGNGTFNIWTGGNRIEDVYIDGSTLTDALTAKFDSRYANSALLASANNIFTGTNGFNSLSATTAEADSAVFGSARYKSGTTTAAISSNDYNFTDVEFVNARINEAIGGSSGTLVNVPTAGQAVGENNKKPVYVDGSGIVRSFDRYTVTKSDTNAVGASNKPVYVTSDGVATAVSGNYGAAKRLMYISGGAFTTSDGAAGSSTNPVYLTGGTITASTSTVGGTTKPVYLKSGVITECNSYPDVAVQGFTDADNVKLTSGPKSVTIEKTAKALTGYTAIGIVGFNLELTSGYTQYRNDVRVHGAWLANSNGTLVCRMNVATSTSDTIVVHPTWTILYKKN